MALTLVKCKITNIKLIIDNFVATAFFLIEQAFCFSQCAYFNHCYCLPSKSESYLCFFMGSVNVTSALLSRTNASLDSFDSSSVFLSGCNCVLKQQ